MTMRMMDYEVEEWIRSQTNPWSLASTGPKITWQHRVQYAVGHAVNDYFTLDPAVRLQTPVQVLLNRRWPRSKDDFPDPLHYWQVYNNIVAQLTLITGMMIYDYPVALYEKWGTPVPGLDLHLSVIFQAVWQNRRDPRQVKIQKFLVEDNEELIKAFTHMTHVFWNSAFGGPPGEIEIYALLDDRKYTITGEALNLQHSLDYVFLLAETIESLKPAEDEERQEKGEEKCPFAYEPWRLGFS